MKFTLFIANERFNLGNCIYPHKRVITSKEEMLKAIKYDNVSAEYTNFYRGKDTFITADNIVMDCDNDHSENPSDWIDDDKLETIFKDINYVVVHSRHHQKQKKDKSPRPRFHIYFETEPITVSDDFSGIKKLLFKRYPFFDNEALDAGRLIFATDEKDIIWHEGSKNITDVIGYDPFEEYCKRMEERNFKQTLDVIPEGHRNSYLSRFASVILKKYGITGDTEEKFYEESKKCNPPLEDSELKTIYNSALNFYKNKVLKDPNYVKPEEYNSDETNMKPQDYSDLGQAEVFAKIYQDEVRFNEATKHIVYDNTRWVESDVLAHKKAQEFTEKQIKDASKYVALTRKKLEDAHIIEYADTKPKLFDTLEIADEDKKLLEDHGEAKRYLSFAKMYRNNKHLSALRKEIAPKVYIDNNLLDANEFYLNTPKCTYDLRKGLNGSHAHNPKDYITKVTSVSPSTKGMDIWLDCLKKIFVDDELIDYVQKICGLACVGKVYVEAIIISYGDGGNGKSTFWNTVARCLGDYYGKVSPEILTTNCNRNTKPEIAELRGKRLIIASESQEGARLSESMVKQLSSIDDIEGEKKYKNPFHFTPGHTLVLYTNHLPKLGSNDDGILRRLIIIPFTNKLTGEGDIKNFSEYLFNNAGEAVLKWVIEGAKKIIDDNFILTTPKCVTDSFEEYREANDWFKHFLDDRCELGKDFQESSNSLYQAYRKYCMDTNEYVRSTNDFYSALKKSGFIITSINRRKVVKGLKLTDLQMAFDDFLE